MSLEFVTEVNKEILNNLKKEIQETSINTGKKFNIKIKPEDLNLIDYIAEKHNIPRSSILNKVIDDIIKHEIDSIEDFDAKILVARTADHLYGHKSEEPGRWICWVLRHHIKELEDNYYQWNYSQPMLVAPEEINSNNSSTFNFFKSII